jgi:hypothetical protein
MISVFGGAAATLALVSGLTAILQKRGLVKRTHQRVWWLVAMVGMAERAIVTTLLIWAPPLTAGFVGGWVLLKFAGGWTRYKEPSVENRAIFMVAMLGNVLSIGWAVLCALNFAPGSLAALAKPN